MYFYGDAKIMFCPETETLCQGRRCMKWRWSNAEHTHGYCGAAGPQPEFPIAEPTGDLNAYTLEEVELFGHTRIFGRVREITKSGCGFLLIDVPLSNRAYDGPTRSFLYAQRAVFSRTDTSLEEIMDRAEYLLKGARHA